MGNMTLRLMGRNGALRTKKIEQNLAKGREVVANEVKLLLLGAGESGKTTIYRQLLLSTNSGFSEEYREEMKPLMLGNVLESMKFILRCIEEVDVRSDGKRVTLEGLGLKAAARTISEARTDNLGFDTDLADAINDLWSNAVVQTDVYSMCLKDGSFDVPDSLPMMMEKFALFPSWGGPNWLPTDADVLLVRSRTTGFAEARFNINDQPFRLIDVGGQRNERRKWLNLFDNVNTVLFVFSLSDYDQTLFEDHNMNRLTESLSLVKETVENDVFKNSTFIIFMNKCDLFTRKYYKEKVPLNFSGNFPDAPLVEDEADERCELALNWFQNKVESSADTARRVKLHFRVTNALDTKKMQQVLTVVARQLLEEKLQAAGLIDT